MGWDGMGWDGMGWDGYDRGTSEKIEEWKAEERTYADW